MGRVKGTKLTEEQKLKMKEGRQAARKVKEAYVEGKPVLHITGKEKDGFDFWKPLRVCLRALGQNMLCKQIEKEISDPLIYRNVGIVLTILEKYCIIREDGTSTTKEKKPRKVSTYVMTEEHKKKLQEARLRKKGETN